METFDHIRKISFVFFIFVGMLHFLSGLFFVNGYAPAASNLINRISFIPFVLVSLSYALSNLKYNLMQYGKNSKAWDYAFLTIGLLTFLILVSIELLMQDSPKPLIPPNLT